MNQPDQDRRQFPRLNSCAALFIRTLDEPRLTIRCHARDISARGLQIQAEHPLEAQRPIELWIKLDDQPGTFLLSGHICWLREAEPGFMMGITLIDSAHDIDTDSWRALLLPLPNQPDA